MTKIKKHPIFITANGAIGHRVAMRLLKAGYSVRVGVPDPTTAADLQSHGAEIVPFAWEIEESYTAALEDVKQVFCVINPHFHKGWAVHFPKFFEQCRAKKVDHFVKVSFYHALTATRAHVMKSFHVALPDDNPFQNVPMIREHGDCDEIVLRSNQIDYTFLFVTHKMCDTLILQGNNLKNGNLVGASGGKGVNYCSPNDIAATAVHVLVDPKPHKRKAYTLTGTAAVLDSEVASFIGKALNKTVSYVDLHPTELAEEEKKEGDRDWLIADLVSLEQLKATGMEIGFLSQDFEKMCGRKAETWEAYLASKEDMTPLELQVF